MKFTDALDRTMESVKRPPNPPVGHYTWQVKKHPENDSFDSRNSGKTFDRVNFQMVAIEPQDDVDPDDLNEYGDVAGFITNKSFLFDNGDEQAFERSMYNLKRFLEHLGVDEGLALSEALAACVGTQCVGELKHRPDPNDAEIIYAELGRTAQL
jgi:hypothetical protein